MTRKPRRPAEYAFAKRDDSASWIRGFETRDAAVEAGFKWHEGENFVTAVIRNYNASYFLPFDMRELLDDIADTAESEMSGGEGAEADWTLQLRAVGKQSKYIPERNDLDERFRKAFDEWAAAHNLIPEFFAIGSIAYHGSEREDAV